jgi:hypothetical protein
MTYCDFYFDVCAFYHWNGFGSCYDVVCAYDQKSGFDCGFGVYGDDHGNDFGFDVFACDLMNCCGFANGCACPLTVCPC